jgi:hypothetical protein
MPKTLASGTSAYLFFLSKNELLRSAPAAGFLEQAVGKPIDNLRRADEMAGIQ